MNCPKCHSDIPNTNINIAADIAQCAKCSNIFKISENITPSVIDIFDRTNTPNGAWFKQDFNLLVVGATTRSWMALYIVPFMFVWSGFSLGGIYGTQIMEGNFNLFTSLFGIPFCVRDNFYGRLCPYDSCRKSRVDLRRRRW